MTFNPGVPLRESAIADAFRRRPFQKVAAQFAVQNRTVVIADQPGLGKTLESIAAVVQNGKGGSVLVVAPKTAVHVTWEPELRQWLSDVAPEDSIRTITGNSNPTERLATLYKTLTWQRQYLTGERPAYQRQWILTTPNYLRFKYKLDDNNNFEYQTDGSKIVLPVRESMKGFLAVHWTVVIVDEAHQTLAGAHGDIKKQSSQSRGLRMLAGDNDCMRIALSGTPFRGKHENLWGILNWLKPKDYPSYWNWVGQHFFQYQDPVYGQIVLTDIKSEAALNKEIAKLMIRRTKAEVAKDLPPKMYGGHALNVVKGKVSLEDSRPPHGLCEDARAAWFHNHRTKLGPQAVWLELTPEQRRMYDEMQDLAMARITGGTLHANGVLAEIIRLKQFANSGGKLDDAGKFVPALPSNKFDWLVEFLRARGIDGKGPGDSKVLVASQFSKHLHLFRDELERMGIPTFLLTGEVSSNERVRMQNEFQNSKDSPDVFLFNTKAGGVAITLDAADDVVIVDQTPTPDDQEQVEDRAHRISRTDHNVSIWNLASLDTIDERILTATTEMGVSLRQVLDGERGVDIAMRLITGQGV